MMRQFSKDVFLSVCVGVVIVLLIISCPWANTWAQQRLDAEDRACLALGFTQA